VSGTLLVLSILSGKIHRDADGQPNQSDYDPALSLSSHLSPLRLKLKPLLQRSEATYVI
jgi:hypothetical protein